MSRKSKALIAVPIAAALVVGGATAAYGVMSTSVEVTVDGKTEKFRTFGDTVADVLKDREITVEEGDKLNVDPSKKLTGGDEIVVQYAKPVRLAVDGKVTKHTLYDATVEDAFETLDVDVPSGAYVSDELDDTIARTGQTLVVSSTKKLVVEADGKKHKITTNEPLVSDVLDEAGVKLDGDDEIAPGADSFVKPEADLEVVRIKKVDKTEKVKTDFDVEVQKDPEAYVGEKEVVKEGVPGQKREEVTLIYANGKVRERVVHESETLKKPVAQVEKRGTKKKEAEKADLSGVWGKLAQCESGGNPRANNGGMYFGLYQFSQQTWNSVGGSGNPMDASPAEQTKRAKILQEKAGWGQWPACARKIGLL